MPLSNLLRTAAGTCRYCGNKAGILNRDHPECRRTFDAGWMGHRRAKQSSAEERQSQTATLNRLFPTEATALCNNSGITRITHGAKSTTIVDFRPETAGVSGRDILGHVGG